MIALRQESYLLHKTATFFFSFSAIPEDLDQSLKSNLGELNAFLFCVIPIPVGIFLEMTAQGTAEVSVSLNKDIL